MNDAVAQGPADVVGSQLQSNFGLLQLVVYRLKHLQERRAELLEAGVDARQLATAITQAEGGLLWLQAATSDMHPRPIAGAVHLRAPRELELAKRAWAHLEAGGAEPCPGELLDWFRRGVAAGRINPDTYGKG